VSGSFAPAVPVTGTVVVGAFGAGVELAVGGSRAPEVLQALPRLWELCPAPPGEPRARVHVVLDPDPDVVARARSGGAASGPDLADLLQLVTQRVTVAAIDARAGECLMFHAACLADPGTGHAAAFVAAGGTGKTTLVRTLGPRRWYVTDETTAVLDDGTVVPYPKPLSLRRAPDSPAKDEVAPPDLGLTAPEGPVTLGGLALLDRKDGHRGAPRVELLGTLEALVALVPQASHLPELSRPLQRLAALAESLGGVHRVTYREAADLAAVVDELTGVA
jgi:hypothetical protein